MAISLNGTSQYINMGTDRNLARNVSQSTFMAWVRQPAAQNSKVVLGIAIGPPPGIVGTSRISLETSPNLTVVSPFTNGDDIGVVLRASDSDAGFAAYGSGGQLVANTWCHVCVTVNWPATSAMTIYHNAAPVTLTGSSSGTPTWTAGNTSNTNTKQCVVGVNEDGLSGFFSGQIEDVRVYNRILSQAEIETIYNSSGADGITDGLELWLPFKEGADGATIGSNVIKDQSNNTITGSGVASPTWYDGITAGSKRLIIGG